MAEQKSLQKGSKFNDVDLDGDGIVSDAEISRTQQLLDLENKDKKEDQLRMMAWVAMGSMVVFTAALYTPAVPLDRLAAIDNILQMFYIAQAGVVATFFGANAYMSK
jgi:hypothetical protein